jgi:hypothetical protein
VCDRLERKWAYCLFGALQVLLAVAMAEAPHTEASFVVLSSAYNVAVGMAYAGFSALVLEVIGRGAAATKYNMMASLSNMPIGYVTWIDGQLRALGPGRCESGSGHRGLGPAVLRAGGLSYARGPARTAADRRLTRSLLEEPMLLIVLVAGLWAGLQTPWPAAAPSSPCRP